jgi:hypothetical protein
VCFRWWERNRQVIRNLNLKYPTASELRKLATLAQVKSRKRFGDHIESIILDAHLNHSALNTLTVPKVRETLQGVRQQAKTFAALLQSVDIVNQGSAQRAGMLLEWELNHPPKDGLFLIPGLRQGSGVAF